MEYWVLFRNTKKYQNPMRTDWFCLSVSPDKQNVLCDLSAWW